MKFLPDQCVGIPAGQEVVGSAELDNPVFHGFNQR